VDLNLFPGGFNNLNPDFMVLCIHAAMSAVQKICPDTRRIMLVPENHTRNSELPAERRGAEEDPRGRRPGGAHRQPHPRPAGALELATAAATSSCWSRSSARATA
jgi:hypothetical protein